MTAALLVIGARVAFVRVSAAGSVDHFYWILAARAYRAQRGFPVRIEGKYLLEDERQTYPPGFGLFLALFPETILRGPVSVWIVVALDAVTLAALLVAASALGVGAWGLVALVAVYGFAPVLVAYNTQLTSRGLGNLFLVVKLLSEAAAVASDGVTAAALWSVAIFASALVILTHKMTTQFMVALWPFWALVLGSLTAALSPILGLMLATAVTGLAFQRMQWSTHLDIVRFWDKHWRSMGVHPFHRSPIYGNPAAPAPGAFHQPGVAGMRRHAILAAAYLPAAWLLPLTPLFAAAPPAWIVTWLLVALAAALATLFLPRLKCLGGGQLYLFNAVAPAALWWAFLVATPTAPVLFIFLVATIATAGSLALGWHRRSGVRSEPDGGLAAAIEALSCRPRAHVAAFPMTAAERIAFETPHAVLWGGHGFGLDRLEPYFPVCREPLSTALPRDGVTLVLVDTRWWPDGEAALAREFPTARMSSFGTWRLAELSAVEGTVA